MGTPAAKSPIDKLHFRDDLPERGAAGLLRVGRVGKTWGIRGELVVRLENDESELAWAGPIVWLRGPGFPLQAVEVAAWTDKGSRQIVRFRGIDTPEDAAAIVGLEILVPYESLPQAPEGEYYVHELVGMTVVDQLEVELGTLAAVIPGPTVDAWEVQGARGEKLIPALKNFILEVDRERRRIRVAYEEG